MSDDAPERLQRQLEDAIACQLGDDGMELRMVDGKGRDVTPLLVARIQVPAEGSSGGVAVGVAGGVFGEYAFGDHPGIKEFLIGSAGQVVEERRDPPEV